MSCTKKSQASWEYGIFDICLGILIVIFPSILLKNFTYAFIYMFLLSSFSSLNAINLAKRVSPLTFSTSLINYEEVKTEKVSSKKNERKEFSLFKCASSVLCGVFVYYVFSVLFGASVFESCTSTVYFSCLMVLLTVYPLMWYFFFSDSAGAVLRIFLDVKFDNTTESHLYAFTVWTVIGAWFGAFPIPLDWDRPWQIWPITCCIGASLGFATAHLYMGSKLLHAFFKDTRKISSNRLV